MKMRSHQSLVHVLSLVLGICLTPESVFAIDCSYRSLNYCLSTTFGDAKINVYHLDDDVPAWGENVVQVLNRCETYNAFSQCVKSITPYCNSSMQLALQGLDNAYQYLCTTEGMQAFVGNQSCYMKPETREAASNCNITYMYNLRLLASSSSKNSASLYCKYVDSYIDCLSNAITLRCGERAAKWQNNWIRNLRRPEMEANKCPGWITEEQSDNVWARALMVALALTTTLMIIGIIVLIVFIIRKRMMHRLLRRNLSSSNPDSDQTPLPPPYSIVVESPGPDGEMQPHLVDSLSSAATERSAPRDPASSASTPGAPYVPHKTPILPPPYDERLEDPAPAYEATPSAALGTVNAGYHEDSEKSQNKERSSSTGIFLIQDSFPPSDA